MLTQDRPTQPKPELWVESPSNNQLLLNRPITVKAIVTPLWKDEARQQLQSQSDQLDEQLTQLDTQVQQMVGELSQHTIQIVGADNSTVAEAQAQIQGIQAQANERKNELLQQKNQVLQQLEQVQTLELGLEVDQGQVDNFFYVKQGDHFVRKMQVEMVLRDGVIEEIRGEL
ncbi:YlqD family protein [Acaryochloris sp. CCMEE 5410]|uniref:YlqD family protein n=1 Tax=Acaryochloris sp. CCMEE 5410 TaxID=310037 RepID=UPI0002483FBF|nr:YlqD family protein [Acaryochloris sp. CCMEE 5410]KAI9129874.1 YlqD family protein [Acaryochloris sp. CCMEE 5410]